MTTLFQRLSRRQRIEAIRRICRDRGLTITTDGKTWLIEGPDIHLQTCDLANVDERDLAPAFYKATA